MSYLLLFATFASCVSAAAEQVTPRGNIDRGDLLAMDARGHMSPHRAKRAKKHHQEFQQKGKVQLCKSLQKLMKERRCWHKGVSLLKEQHSKMVPMNAWPLSTCSLPRPSKRPITSKSYCSVTFAASADNAEHIWARLNAGGLVVFPMVKPMGSAFIRSEFGAVAEDPEKLIWQSLYQINSNLGYWNTDFGENFKAGLPDLQFATFMPGHALLQKADHSSDLANANGTFWKLADASGTDKIDAAHNYSLLYHRHLDENRETLNALGGMFLEIGLGCMLEKGNAAIAGRSAKLWPRMFNKVAVHFIEIDRLCTQHWEPHMQEAGVAKVHIGAQADTNILAGVVHDAKFAKPGGFVSVVDDGSHLPADIEKSFRMLLPSLKSGGLYFIEDMMFASWGDGYMGYQRADMPQMKINSKYDHSSATPVALTAVLAAGVTGLADVPKFDAEKHQRELYGEEEEETDSTRAPDTTFFGPLTDQLDVIKAHVKARYTSFVDKFNVASPTDYPVTNPVKSWNQPEEWRNEILAATGALVDFIECSPGICVFRRV